MTPFPLYQTTCFFIPLVAPCTPILGYEPDSTLKPNTVVTHNGFRFRFMIYSDEFLRAIQFYMIESELEQAVGRVRLLRCDCTVNLFSDFPLRQAELMDAQYDKEQSSPSELED